MSLVPQQSAQPAIWRFISTMYKKINQIISRSCIIKTFSWPSLPEPHDNRRRLSKFNINAALLSFRRAQEWSCDLSYTRSRTTTHWVPWWISLVSRLSLCRKQVPRWIVYFLVWCGWRWGPIFRTVWIRRWNLKVIWNKLYPPGGIIHEDDDNLQQQLHNNYGEDINTNKKLIVHHPYH